MNNLTVESAIKAALAESAFPTTTLYTGTDYQELTPESLNLIISVAQVDQTAPGLYKAQTTIRVMSPALLGADAKAQLVATLDDLKAALTTTYLTEHWPDSGVPTFGGIWITGTRMSQEEHSWVAEIEAIVGLAE
jgi:hypothetical protein